MQDNQITNAVEIFKCLGDSTRFRILCRLYKSDSYVELLAHELELTPGTISFHLKKMENIGIVKCSRMQFYMIYSLNREIISNTIESFLVTPESSRDELYISGVLSSFFNGKRLKQIPVQEKKKRIVLEKIAENFESGRVYSEREVSEILFEIYDDYCTLRRELISYGYMERTKGEYRLTEENAK